MNRAPVHLFILVRRDEEGDGALENIGFWARLVVQGYSVFLGCKDGKILAPEAFCFGFTWVVRSGQGYIALNLPSLPLKRVAF